MEFRNALWSLSITYALIVSPSSLAITVFKVGDIQGGYNSIPAYNGWSLADGLTGNFSRDQCGAIILQKKLDKASVKYIEAAVFGTVYPRVEIHDLRKFDAQFEPETIIEIKDAQILKVEAIKEEGDALREIVIIQPMEMKIQYRVYDDNGNRLGNVETILNCSYKAK